MAPAHVAAAAQAGCGCLPWALTPPSDGPDDGATVGAFGGASLGCSLVCVSRRIRDELSPRTIEGTASVIPCGVSIPARATRFRKDPFHVVISGRAKHRIKRLLSRHP